MVRANTLSIEGESITNVNSERLKFAKRETKDVVNPDE
jgi:hypothetical protein